MIEVTRVGTLPWMVDLARIVDGRALRQVTQAAAVIALDHVKPYPSARAHPARGFASDKSRRYFFFALRHGLIDVPYRRGQSRSSEALGRSWTMKLRSDTEAVIGTAVSYAPLVKGARQSPYMATLGWTRIDDDMLRAQGDIRAVIDAGVRKILGVA